MEKTNRCCVAFLCWGNIVNCELSEPSTPEQGMLFNNVCRYWSFGNCTNKQAQIRALDDEGFEMEKTNEH